MRTFAFLGLVIINLLFNTTVVFSFNPYYLTNCECLAEVRYQDFYLFLNLGSAVFFLLFCTLLLIKETELVHQQKTSDHIPTDYTIYQLPLVQSFSKISFIACLGLFILAAFYPTYDPIGDCPSPLCHIDFSATNYYPLWYSLSGLYFTFLSVLVHRKISPFIKQKNKTAQ